MDSTRSRIKQRARLGLTVLAVLPSWVICGEPAWGLINPNYTPADLVRSASQIILLEISTPRGGTLTATVVKTLKGKAPAKRQLSFDLAGAEQLGEEEVRDAMLKRETAPAVLLLRKADDDPDGDAPTGALQIGVTWFAVHGPPNKWRLDADEQGLLTVWAGSARMLAAATEYVLNDPTARFPVRSALHWARDLKLGSLGGPAAGCLAVDLGPPKGRRVIVLSKVGDRAYGVDRSGKLTDATNELGMKTASKMAVPGDFNGDDRVDLACWDGNALVLALQQPDGKLAMQPRRFELSACRSINAIDCATPTGSALLAGTPEGPILLAPDGNGSFTSKPLGKEPSSEQSARLGPGAVCTVADFNGDGHCDVISAYSSGLVFYSGTGPGQFMTPVVVKIALVQNPSCVICGDYDADGQLDLTAVGETGVALIGQGESGRWENRTMITGELDYHGNANTPRIVGAGPCDVNNDGRQAVALFYPQENPMLFFSRGFACFGLARELLLTGGGLSDDPEAAFGPMEDDVLPAAKALERGQSGGVVVDLDGSGTQDLLAVTPQGEVWAMFSERTDGRSALALELALPSAFRGPLTVRVSNNRRYLGTHVIRPGIPAFVGCPVKGPYQLQWIGHDGKPQTQRVIVIKNMRVEVTP